MPLLEYHHSLPTRVMIWLSPSIRNTNWLLPELTNSSLIFLNFTKNSRRLSFYPRNSTNALQIEIGSLLRISKSVTEFLSMLSFSVQPVQQRGSPKSISVLMRSLTKQVLYPGLSIYLTPCVRSIPFSMFPCWNQVLRILFQTVLNLLCHQYSLMASLNMKSQRFSTLNWITDAISVYSFIWSGGLDMKVPMKKPLGYLPMNLLMLPTLSPISTPNILPNPALSLFNKSVHPFLFLSVAFLSITFSV